MFGQIPLAHSQTELCVQQTLLNVSGSTGCNDAGVGELTFHSDGGRWNGQQVHSHFEQLREPPGERRTCTAHNLVQQEVQWEQVTNTTGLHVPLP